MLDLKGWVCPSDMHHVYQQCKDSYCQVGLMTVGSGSCRFGFDGLVATIFGRER